MFKLSSSPSQDEVFLWVLHAMSETFKEHAVLRGGMTLRLLNCHRSTNDLDYVLIPFDSKKDVLEKIDGLFSQIEGAKVSRELSSKAIHYVIQLKKISIQVEINVSKECSSVPISTDTMAKDVGQLTKIIRVMSYDVSMAHKIAAWNERRLLRDLYDIYFYNAILKISPDLVTLKNRLSKIESRLPTLKKQKKMTFEELAKALTGAVDSLTEKHLEQELGVLLPAEELKGLKQKITVAIRNLVEKLL